MGHRVSRERLSWPQQLRDRPGCKIKDRAFAKRGCFDPDDASQFGSAAPSEFGPSDDEQGTFAVPRGRAPRAAKKATPLSAPGVTTGSVTGQDDKDWRSDSRSGFKDEREIMDVDQAGRSSGQKSHKMRRSRRLRKLTQRRSSLSRVAKRVDALDRPTGMSSLRSRSQWYS